MSSDRPRDIARRAVDEIRASAPGALRLGAIDLSEALETALFSAARRGTAPAVPLAGLRSVARIVRAVALSRRWAARYEPGSVIVLAHWPIHLTLFAPVEAELLRRGIRSQRVAVGRAKLATAEWLHRSLSLQGIMQLIANSRAVLQLVRRTHRTRNDGERLLRAAGDVLPRLAVQAAHLDAILAQTRPACVVTFNEVGLWSRLAPAVARARGIPSVDLPHAEAADREAIEGLPHDAIAVYGPRSADLMAQAGVAPERLHVIGPLRYDLLAARAAQSRPPSEPLRVLYASQPVRPEPHLSRGAKRRVFSAALSAAGALAPSVLVVVPHPTEPIEELLALVDKVEPPPGVRVVRASEDLHDLLIDAALLVTAFSQSVFDAAVVGVPALMVRSEKGSSPVPYAAEGFAIEVHDATTARAAAARLLDPSEREAAVARAKRALAGRFGVVDGRAHVRAADLIERVARGGGRRT